MQNYTTKGQMEEEKRGNYEMNNKGMKTHKISEIDMKLFKPVIQFLKDNYHPHTALVITDERVVVIEEITSIPNHLLI